MVKYEFLRQTRLTLQNSNKSQCINKLVFNFWPKRYIPSDWPKTVECIRNIFPTFFQLIYTHAGALSIENVFWPLFSHSWKKICPKRKRYEPLLSSVRYLDWKLMLCSSRTVTYILYCLLFVFVFKKWAISTYFELFN